MHNDCSHLTPQQQNKLLQLLERYTALFDRTLGDGQTYPTKYHLHLGEKPYHGRVFSIPHSHKDTLKKEVMRLVNVGVLKKQPSSEWTLSTLIIPGSHHTVGVIYENREVTTFLVLTPLPIPKISSQPSHEQCNGGSRSRPCSLQ